jgi:hypothetical protein
MGRQKALSVRRERQSGWPCPLGSRSKFGDDFISDFYADWQEGGRATIK